LKEPEPSDPREILEEISHVAFQKDKVRLDGKLFLNCSFEDCLLCYGGARSEWKDTKFANCRLLLDGAANNTVHVLQGLGFTIESPTAAPPLDNPPSQDG